MINYELELNKKQFEAVSSKSQYLRIVAGAGSGKTRVLTYRIAYLIEHCDVFPSQILAITFTNKVANEMLTRTKNLLPDYDLNYLKISTYHSFCAKFLRREIEKLSIPSSFLIMDEDDCKSLVKSIGESLGYQKKDEIIKQAYNFICSFKGEGKLPSDAEKELHGRNPRLLEFFVEYEKRKNAMHQLDFDDLIIDTILILENFPEVRHKWQNYFKHILIDEFQDTNNREFHLLRLLVNEETNIFVVGDPDQTIYTWRGANQRIILDFDNVFVPTETIILNENYRSTSNILNAANKLIKNNVDRIHKDLYTENEEGQKVTVKRLNSPFEEAKYIINKIRDMKFANKEIKYHDFAILYRSSYLTQKIETVFVEQHIPYKIYGNVKFYDRKEIKDVLAYFKILMNPDDDISFERIINVPRRKIGETTVSLIKKESEDRNLHMISYLCQVDKKETEIGTSALNKIDELLLNLQVTRNRLIDNNESYSEVLREFINRIGYMDFLEEDEEKGDERIENVDQLLNDVRDFLKANPDSSFNEYLQNIALLSAQDDIDDSDTVSLMTVHTAKGLEFPYVFILSFAEDVFPNKRAIDEAGAKGLEEERRLAYVAATRAKKELFLTYNSGYNYISSSSSSPSRFISEMGLEAPKEHFENEKFGGFFNSEAPKSEHKIYNFGAQTDGNLGNQVFNIGEKNNIVWNVGDIAIHKVFGEGEVIAIEGEIITVNFKNFGQKQLLGNHPKLSKKG